MTTFDRFDRDLAVFLDAETALRAPDGLHADAMAAVRRQRQRPGWIVALRLAPLHGPRAALRPSLIVVVVLAVLAALAVIAGGASRRDLSPFGRTNGAIAYMRGDDPGPFQLWTACSDLTAARQLHAPGVLSMGWPAWSPDGTRIVFNATTDPSANPTSGRWNIWTMAPDGTDARTLTAATGLLGDPSWSPDGSLIAYASSERGNEGIWVMDAATGRNAHKVIATAVAGTPTDYAPTFADAGRRLLFTRQVARGPALFAVNLDGTLPEELTTSDLEVDQAATSPDGSRAAIAATTVRYPRQNIWVLDLDRRQLKALDLPALATDGRVIGYSSPTWSPDGSRLLAVRGFHSTDGSVEFGLVSFAPDGTDLRPIGAGDEKKPSWGSAAC